MLMDGNRVEDLQRMYNLFSRVNALESLRQALSSYIRKTGQGIVMDEEKDKDMVSSLLDFKASLDTIWEDSYFKNEPFCNTIKDSFEHLINLRQVLSFFFKMQKEKNASKCSCSSSILRTECYTLIIIIEYACSFFVGNWLNRFFFLYNELLDVMRNHFSVNYQQLAFTICRLLVIAGDYGSMTVTDLQLLKFLNGMLSKLSAS